MTSVQQSKSETAVTKREVREGQFSPRRDTGEIGRHPELRADLVMRAEPGGNGGGCVLAPVEGGADRSYVFGPHEFHLAACLNGERNLEQIRATMVESDPSLGRLRVEQIERLVDWLDEMGLLVDESIAKSPAHPLLPLAQPGEADGLPPTSRRTGEARPVDTASLNRSGSGVVKKSMVMIGKAACLAVVIWCVQAGATWLRAERENREAGALVAVDGAVALAAEFDGVLREVWVRDGDKVYPGDLLAHIDNLDIQRELEQLRRQLIECQQRRDDFYQDGDTYEYRREVQRLAAITQRIGRLRFDREQVEVRAPIAGVVRVGVDLREQIGARILTGQRLLVVEPSRNPEDRGMLVTSAASGPEANGH